ncbi:acyl-CoA N-acyltransferase [Rhizodiscina lignyota]|uniref:Acyl-CoA N-acyltransferase n=1 Tax=Rhizodiscina lignyota TaxID=1504668 RepID=A0A9P4IHL0_9PEZI|nr:acyl-CoA N-acyltransferase [Rhizodiscina lignyota]
MASSFLSERLIYRAPEDTPQDKAFILALQSDRACAENATRYLVKPMSPADVDMFLRQIQDCLLGVLVCLPESSALITTKPIGFVTLKGTSQPHHRNSTMSIQICREEQGKGYGTEAVKWALEWGFMTAGLHRVSIGCFSFNEGARKLYVRLGFVVEGRTREAAWKNGGWHDVIEMGMLEGEWREKYLIDGRGNSH